MPIAHADFGQDKRQNEPRGAAPESRQVQLATGLMFAIRRHRAPGSARQGAEKGPEGPGRML